MHISIITLFPGIFEESLNYSILKRAQEKGVITFSVVNHREFGIGKHKIVDDKPYGGGAGMVLRVDVLANAIAATRKNTPGEVVVLLDPQGEVYSQAIAEEFCKLQHIILVCGHYEGFDERVRTYVDREISIGDFVLTGGEIPALAVIDSVTRLLPGVLKDETATLFESHSLVKGKRILEGPHFTRPEIYKGAKVPVELLSGNPKIIENYKAKEAVKKTAEVRPELLK